MSSWIKKHGIEAVAVGIGLLALGWTIVVDQREQKRWQIQQVPRLTATASIGEVFVGRSPSRIDDLVSVPMHVFKQNTASAYDVELDLVFADGTGREVSLNDYQRGINAPIIETKTIGAHWSPGTSFMSAPQHQRYESGDLRARAKLQLTWKDGEGRQHRFVELSELAQSEVVEGHFGGRFWWKPIASYSSLDGPEKVREHWGLPFKQW